jgi:hypothetical protein
MKSLLKLLMASLLLGAFAVSTASADADKGQRYYLKIFKPQTGFNGTKFAAMHTQAEWEDMFADNGKKFIAEWSEEYPKLKPFLQSDKFQMILPDIKDFAVKYASDSGNVPSC